MSDDHLIIEKDADLLDVLQRPVRAKRRKKRTEKQKAKSSARSKIVKSTREKNHRKARLLAGLCTYCGKRPSAENRRSCDECGEKATERKFLSRFNRKNAEAEDD